MNKAFLKVLILCLHTSPFYAMDSDTKSIYQNNHTIDAIAPYYAALIGILYQQEIHNVRVQFYKGPTRVIVTPNFPDALLCAHLHYHTMQRKYSVQMKEIWNCYSLSTLTRFSPRQGDSISQDCPFF